MKSQQKKYLIESQKVNPGMFCTVADGSAGLARRLRGITMPGVSFGGYKTLEYFSSPIS
jgi:hypothetical protein